MGRLRLPFQGSGGGSSSLQRAITSVSNGEPARLSWSWKPDTPSVRKARWEGLSTAESFLTGERLIHYHQPAPSVTNCVPQGGHILPLVVLREYQRRTPVLLEHGCQDTAGYFHHDVTLSSPHFVHKENQGPERLSESPRLTQQAAETGSGPSPSNCKGRESSVEPQPPSLLFLGQSPFSPTASLGVPLRASEQRECGGLQRCVP